MTRRDGMKLSAVTAAAILTGCSKKSDPREKSRAHSTAMFLLILNAGYLQQAYSTTVQSQLPAKSLLTKVMPKVFDSMRTYLQAQVRQYGEAAIIDRYKAIHNEMFAATSSTVQTAGTDQPPYSTPDECPCMVDDSCPQVEALLGF